MLIRTWLRKLNERITKFVAALFPERRSARRRFRRIGSGIELLEDRVVLNADPVFTSANAGLIPENSWDAMTVQAADYQGNPVSSYSISGGNDSGMFSLDSITGDLAFSLFPDYESPADMDLDNVYEIEVMADDGMGGFASQLISVTVTDEADAVQFASPSNATVEENFCGYRDCHRLSGRTGHFVFNHRR